MPGHAIHQLFSEGKVGGVTPTLVTDTTYTQQPGDKVIIAENDSGVTITFLDPALWAQKFITVHGPTAGTGNISFAAKVGTKSFTGTTMDADDDATLFYSDGLAIFEVRMEHT